MHARDGHDRQHLLSSQRRHGPRRRGDRRRQSHRPDAAPLPGRRARLRRASLLGPLDVRLPAFRLWPHRARAGRRFQFPPRTRRRAADRRDSCGWRDRGTAAGRRQLDLLPRRLRAEHGEQGGDSRTRLQGVGIRTPEPGIPHRADCLRGARVLGRPQRPGAGAGRENRRARLGNVHRRPGLFPTRSMGGPPLRRLGGRARLCPRGNDR